MCRHHYIGPILLMLVAATVVAEEPPESSPVVVDDGKDSFLILNDDEVNTNPLLTAFLSSANKEDLEELVDSNPKYQETILNRIRNAVEQRQKNKRKGASAVVPTNQMATQTIVEPSKSMPIGMPQEEATGQIDGANAGDEDDGEDDDDHVMDKLKMAKLKADVKKNALKIFRIGTGLRGKLVAYLRKSKLKSSKKKSDKKQGTEKLAWPVFHYHVSTG